ncbi:MAG TPA: hypothetical protein VFV31_13710 [Chitinophagaceae bacterium]|nr:hypothetical protein [Chitinophagaceae bacterium]
MKKLLLFLLAFSLLTACKNDKGGGAKKTETQATDDYRSGDEKNKDDKTKTEENKEPQKNGDDLTTGEKNETDDNTNMGAGGWPETEKSSFITSCVREAMKNGNSRSVSTSYCQCMLEKLEAMYPDINEAAKLSDTELERVMMKYKDGCLNQ